MHLKDNLQAGVSEGETGKEAHGKPARVQGIYVKVPSGLEGGQYMQGEESGGGGRIISG